MFFSDSDTNNLPWRKTYDEKVDLLLKSISAEEIRLTKKIHESIEKLWSKNDLSINHCENDSQKIIDALILQNSDIEKVLTESIKKEMNFQLELDESLDVAHINDETKDD